MRLLTAFYDLEHGPVSFDFITWLVRAGVERRRCGAERLHVVVVPKEDGLGGFSRHWGPHDEHAARWRLWHIVLPACALAGATVTLAATREQANGLAGGAETIWWPQGKAHLAKDLVAIARGGEALPVLAATVAARRYVEGWLTKDDPAQVITLTLRQQQNDPARNAARGEWLKLQAWLLERGYRVVLLEDSHRALMEGRAVAELDLDLRLALYERADLNLVGNNGPAALLWHSAAPYLRLCAGMVADWTPNLGLKHGDQVPWAKGTQRLVYRPDTFADMREEIARWGGATN